VSEKGHVLTGSRYKCNNIEIENKRWDPLSAGGSTLFDTVMGLRSDGKTMVASVQKAKTLRRENSDGASSGTGAATVAVGKGLGKISTGFAKGVILDLPVAMADGFHALPVLYGDKKMERGAVKDWKSGMKVGGKVSFGGRPLGEKYVLTGIYRVLGRDSLMDLLVS
jgi:hypothetical protein